MLSGNWEVEIPLKDWSVITEPNPLTGEIKQVTEIAGRIQEQVIQTQANQTRNALIDLGWTPPADSKPQKPIMPAQLLSEASFLSERIQLQGVRLCDLTRADLMVLAVEYCRENAENVEVKKTRGDDPQGDNAQGEPGVESPVSEQRGGPTGS